MKTLNNNPCGVPGCNGVLCETLFEYEDTARRINILKCSKCNTGYHKNMPSEEEIDKFVKDKNQYIKSLYNYFLNDNLEDPIPNYELYDDINKKLLGWSKNTFNHVNRLKFLDFGCGPGFSFNILNYFNWQCYGVEANTWAQKLIKKLYPYVTLIENLRTLKNNSFSLIFMIHSIEHLKDPVGVLKEISRILKPGGELIIHTPDSDDSSIENYYNREHLFFFNEPSLVYWLSKAGLRVTLIDRPPMDPPSIKILAEKKSRIINFDRALKFFCRK